MRNRGILAWMVPLVFTIGGSAAAGDSTSLQLRSSVGYEPPSRARQADRAGQATHAATADSLAGSQGDHLKYKRGPICGTGAPRRCRYREFLPLGYYLITCRLSMLYSNLSPIHDSGNVGQFSSQKRISISGQNGLTPCPGSSYGGTGVKGKILQIVRLS